MTRDRTYQLNVRPAADLQKKFDRYLTKATRQSVSHSVMKKRRIDNSQLPLQHNCGKQFSRLFDLTT